MAIIKVDVFQCNICGWIWYSRTSNRKNPPICCAHCKNPRWDKEVKK